MDSRDEPLLAWQWRHYPENHRNRKNLLLHIVSVPMFLSGTLSVVAAFATLSWHGLFGLVAMGATVAIQGAGHRSETNPPIPFRGPLDAAMRLIVEQWVTFPRFVLTGGFARAWREAGVSANRGV
jgi:hypothetical protein